MITETQFAACFPELGKVRLAELYPHLVRVLNRYEINTPNRIAAFLATCGHESASFKYVSENLNYSADALTKVFKKYFPNPSVANSYAMKPQAIANRVYANRMGNGSESSGDGWKYRGSSFIQITGKNNIGAYALSIHISATDAADYLKTPAGAFDGSGWYWNREGLNAYADSDNFVALCGVVNVGSPNATEAQIHGILDRKTRYAKYKKVLAN